MLYVLCISSSFLRLLVWYCGLEHGIAWQLLVVFTSWGNYRYIFNYTAIGHINRITITFTHLFWCTLLLKPGL
jgi:hypothetical protein